MIKPVKDIAAYLGLTEEDYDFFGRYKAKLNLHLLEKNSHKPKGKYILVTAITPTAYGEGKTTTTIGLGMALEKLGKRSIVALRQSSLGPTMGIKGAGAGGGHARVEPFQESIMHVTGDIHAITQAHNQIAAQLDNHLYHGNELNIHLESIPFKRVLDVNDRCLRKIEIKTDNFSRETGFEITAASELMAILALLSGHSIREVIADLRQRLASIVLGYNVQGELVTAKDIHAYGAAAALMHGALAPTLMQTSEGTPAILHAGPFANIAHGCSSILADQIALPLADYVITEAGFAADMGAEKFFNIKCRASGLAPQAVVLVATVRALKSHGGVVDASKIAERNDEALIAGAENLKQHIKNLQQFGVPVVVAINEFPNDLPEELAIIKQVALAAGARDCMSHQAFTKGGEGTLALAQAVIAASEEASTLKFLYELDQPLARKIGILAEKIYGAAQVEFSEKAQQQLARIEQLGFGKLPICMAKSHLSISHDPLLKGAPKDYIFPVREARLSAGAGFVYCLAGSTVTMPGLARIPKANQFDLSEQAEIIGLS
jgi:formate--tetrahydrofolate ligase